MMGEEGNKTICLKMRCKTINIWEETIIKRDIQEIICMHKVYQQI